MTSEGNIHRIVQVDGGDCVVCAELVTADPAHGTAHVVVHATSGHVASGARTKLIDAVLDLAERRHVDRLEATLPMGDAESLLRIHERCEHIAVRAAGSSALVECRCATPHAPGR